MRYHSILYGSRANGPGVRTAVWMQGCSIHCEGCSNPKTHAFDAGTEIAPELLAINAIRFSSQNTTGITISGGEPTQQPEALLAFVLTVKRHRPWWSIGLFSGRTVAELYTEVSEWPAIERLIDWGVFGPYRRDLPPAPDQRFVSSSNQRLVLLSSRHAVEDFSELQAEFMIDKDGLTTITGFTPATKENE